MCLAACSTHQQQTDRHPRQHTANQGVDAAIGPVARRSESNDASLRVVEDASLPHNVRVLDIAVGRRGACVLLEGGRVSCLSDSNSTDRSSDRQARRCELAPIDFAPTIRELRTGGDFYCVRTTDDAIACWGDNHALACGIYNRPTVNTPTLLGGLHGRSLVLSSAGGCVIHETGLVYCWGAIPDLADGRNADIVLPTPLAGLEGARQVLFPNVPLCLQRSNGVVRCFPSNPREERRLTNWLSTETMAGRGSLTFGTNALCTASQNEVRAVVVSGEATSIPLPNAVAVGCTSTTVCGLSQASLRCMQDGTLFQYTISGASVLGVADGVACVWGEAVGLVCVELRHQLWLSEQCQARQTERGMFIVLPSTRR